MDTSYLKLLNGSSRIKNYMGLVLDPGVVPEAGKNYMYIDLPVRNAIVAEGEAVTEVKRNQHVWIQAAGKVDVKGMNFIEVEPNPALAEMGQVQGLYRIHPGSGEKQLGFWFTARRDVDLSVLKYAVRIYMVA